MNPAMRIVEHNSIPRFNPSTGLVEPFIRDPAIQVRRIHGSEQSIFQVIDRYAVAWYLIGGLAQERRELPLLHF